MGTNTVEHVGTSKLAHELKPSEILAIASQSSCAFVPVSPTFEWHSFHLPVGTDAIIAETFAQQLAMKIRGLCFGVLSLGLDTYRSCEELTRWGFKSDERIFGMNFPDLPLTSEYARKPQLLEALGNRVDAIASSGFRHVFVINHHGGTGQNDSIQTFCQERSTESCRVVHMTPLGFCTLKNDRLLKIGGHAGLAETMALMAFRPDLVDLNAIPEGDLTVRATGILHHEPEIDSQWNPRHAVLAVANDMRHNMLENAVAFVRQQL